ncbi:F-box domain containing protein [Tanacetum coccineum]
MEENTIDTTDRISMLPDSIVHHILSYLLDDPKSRVRMSVLSKGWFALTESFPILHFNLYGAGFYPRENLSLSKGCMKCDTAWHFDILWFQKLRRFLDKNDIFKEVIDVEKLKVIQSPPRELEHVELINAVGINKVSVYATVLDAVLWCCRPRSLTLEVGQFADTSDIVKYTYEKLLQQEDEGQTNINFVMLLSSQDKQHFSDLNSLLKALSLEQEKIKQYFGNEEIFITFIKEEEVQKVTSTTREFDLVFRFLEE